MFCHNHVIVRHTFSFYATTIRQSNDKRINISFFSEKQWICTCFSHIKAEEMTWNTTWAAQALHSGAFFNRTRCSQWKCDGHQKRWESSWIITKYDICVSLIRLFFINVNGCNCHGYSKMIAFSSNNGNWVIISYVWQVHFFQCLHGFSLDALIFRF